jgi:hypothetical protein
MPASKFRLRSAISVTLCAAALLVAPRAMAAAADSTITAPLPITFHVAPPNPCESDTIRLVAVSPCSPCFDITSFERASDGHIRLEFTEMLPMACSTLPCAPQERSIRLGRFMAGFHALMVEVVWHFPPDTANAGGGTRTLQQPVAFEVHRCNEGGLPFVTHIFLGGPSPCATCPPEACPDQPVLIGLQGALPNHCWNLLGFEVLPLLSPMNRPVVRLTVREPCPDAGAPCTSDIPDPFSVGASLPPQLPGPHEVEIQVAVRSCTDSAALKISSEVFGYVVKDSCGPPPPPPPVTCVWPFLEPRHVPADSAATRVCDLRLMPGGRGAMVFAARAGATPLAGLQGEFGASDFLRVENLEAVGAAAGMRLNWTRKGNGAAFVLFSASGAPIPADEWASVLRVTVSADSSVHGPTLGYVYSTVTAGADSNGTSVPPCPIMTLVVVAARVCVGEPASCDANGDGVSNVADLVRMVRCIVQPGTCPDTIAARPDCTGDGEFHLDDVFCCARAILGGPRPGPGRDPGQLSFSFGRPVMVGSLLQVPLHVHGAADMGGALLRIDYPSDRWIAVDPAVAGGDPLRASGIADWTPLLEIGADDILVGVLRLDPSAPTDLTVMLAFSLRPGAEPGGELRVGSSDISASDGTPIALDLASLAATLDSGAPAPVTRVALSPARPNPASGATSFVVSLPAAANVDLAMYDLAGRRVATLAHGTLAAGDRTFTWQPGRVPSGMYFARLVVNGEVRSSRVTLKIAK